MPRRSIDDVKLEPAQYEDMLLEMQNLGTKQYLENIIKSSAYQKLPKSQKIDLIKNVIKKIHHVLLCQSKSLRVARLYGCYNT